jgi:hypothetical protein
MVSYFLVAEITTQFTTFTTQFTTFCPAQNHKFLPFFAKPPYKNQLRKSCANAG